MSGGSGKDTLDMSQIRADITVDLGTGHMNRGSAQSAETGSDVLWSVENFIGGAGNDQITAGRSVNVMDGGAGNDTYRFLSSSDANGDVIAAFEPGDRIDLSRIDANGAAEGDGAFTLVSDAFTGPGQLLVSHESREDGDYTVVEGNVSGDGGQEFKINIKGHHNLTADDFSL
jgi:Ca2+-binding RTX toxin-like protein